MKSLFSTILASTVVTFFIASSVSEAQIIAKWTFDTSQPTTSGPYNPEIGLGSGSGSHAGAAAYSSPVGDGSAHSFSATAWGVNDYWQFSSSTIGYSSIELEWDQISSSTGPKNFDLSYSTDGSSYTPVLFYSALVNATPNAWSSATYNSSSHYIIDLSIFNDLNNAGNVYFRLTDDTTTSAGGGTVASGGTDRVDNFTIEVVPEPSTIGLIGLAGGALLAFRRRLA
jgi:hypothetical protein